MKTRRKQPPRKQPRRKQPPRKVKSVPIKRKQKIQPRIVSSCCSSSSLRQLRINCMDCPTSMEDLSAVDSEASVAAESLRAMAAAISNDPQEHQEQHGQQQIRARPNTSRWTEVEREMLVTFLDTPKKIQTYYNSKADFCRDTADAMALRLGYEFHCERVRRKLTKVEQRLNVSKADKASIAIFMRGLRSALFDPASSSQSGSMQLPRSESSVQLPSSNLQRAESVAEAVSSVSEHVDLTLAQRIKYSKAMLVDRTLYLEVFNSFKTIEGKIDFLDQLSAGH